LRLAAQFAVTQILTEAEDIDGAMAAVTAAVGEALGFEVGGWWEADESGSSLRCKFVWNPLRPLFVELTDAVKATILSPGLGIVMHAWQERRAFFSTEIEPGPLGARAIREGLQSAIVFPILGASGVLGVMGFWTRAAVAQDDELRKVVMDAGAKAGQFIERRRAELAVAQAREELARQLAVMERQASAIQRLSTPMIRVWEGVLAMPVIGALDRDRTDRMTERLLGELARSRSRVVVIDFTGADGVDAETAGHIARVMRAVRLLGSECVVAGVSPEMARALSAEAVMLSEFGFFADVKSALAHVFRRLGGPFAAKG
jgi:anti-anti-sigma regulatory factor